jgi:hypothetical protein
LEFQNIILCLYLISKKLFLYFRMERNIDKSQFLGEGLRVRTMNN